MKLQGTVTRIDKSENDVFYLLRTKEHPSDQIAVHILKAVDGLPQPGQVYSFDVEPDNIYGFRATSWVKVQENSSSRPVPSDQKQAGLSKGSTAPPNLTVTNPESIVSPSFSVRTETGGMEDTELSDSIKQDGVLQPILVRKKDGRLERVAGGRRARAARQAGLTAVPIINLGEITDEESYERQLIENAHRKDLTSYEWGRAFKHALETFPVRYPNQEALGKRIGKTQQWISLQIKAYETAEELKGDTATTTVVSHTEYEHIPETQLRELRSVPAKERSGILKELHEAQPSRSQGKRVTVRKIQEKVKEIKISHDVKAYLTQLAKDAEAKFRELSVILDDVESHQKKASSEELDIVYGVIGDEMIGVLAALPQEQRRRIVFSQKALMND